MTTTIRVATINIYRDLSCWPERRSLLADELGGSSLDLIALQEVTNPLGVSTAHSIAEELGGYSVHVAAKTGWERRREGIAVLSRLPIDHSEVIDLGSQNRVAQLVRVGVGTGFVTLVNGHYFFPVGAHRSQVKQVGRVLGRIRSITPGPTIVCGDFNATPRCRSIALMSRSFRSAHLSRHGHEPEFTCPTRLVSGGKARRTVTSKLYRLLSIHPSDVWRGTVDYLFVSPEIGVVDCGVILEHPSTADPTLYASDHLGLAATLEIPSDPAGSISRVFRASFARPSTN